MNSLKIDILAFAAHPDDAEISCAGTLLKHKALGYSIGIIDLTQGEMGTRGTKESRQIEARNAAEILKLDVRENLKLEDGFIFNDKKSQLKVIEAIRKHKPSIVLANSITDRHTDHGKAAALVKDACFLSGLEKIETIVNGTKLEAFRPNAIYHYIQDQYIKPDLTVDITDYFDLKMDSIKAYKTQFFDPESKEPSTPISGKDFLDFIEAKAIQTGRIIGSKFAEGFTVNKAPGVNDLFHLL